MRQTEKEFAILFLCLGILLGSTLGFSLAHLRQVRHYFSFPKECVCDRSECL